MKNFEKVLLIQHSDIHAAIEKLDNNEAHIVLVIDKNRKLLGTVTDGDVRRGILRGVSLGESITSIMNDNPIFANQNQTKNVIYSIMRKNQIRQIPIVNDSHEVCGLEILDNFSDFNKKNNIVILMAGGLSTRLRPLTNDCPKPMLKVGGKPILETILLSLIESGFHLFYISINYLGEQIKEYFGNGEKWGVSIRYIQEDNKMGTAGALSLIPDVHKDPIIVMNSDLLTTVDFNQLISFHLEQQSTATMCVREFSHTVPYGICTLDNNYIIDIVEKPTYRYFINAGIYILEPEILDIIPKETYLDMPTLFSLLIKLKNKIAAFPIREYWLDIGQFSDYEKAHQEYRHVFDMHN